MNSTLSSKFFMKAMFRDFNTLTILWFLSYFCAQQRDYLVFNLCKIHQGWFLRIDLLKGLQAHLVVRKHSLVFSITTDPYYCNAYSEIDALGTKCSLHVYICSELVHAMFVLVVSSWSEKLVENVFLI